MNFLESGNKKNELDLLSIALIECDLQKLDIILNGTGVLLKNLDYLIVFLRSKSLTIERKILILEKVINQFRGGNESRLKNLESEDILKGYNLFCLILRKFNHGGQYFNILIMLVQDFNFDPDADLIKIRQLCYGDSKTLEFIRCFERFLPTITHIPRKSVNLEEEESCFADF